MAIEKDNNGIVSCRRIPTMSNVNLRQSVVSIDGKVRQIVKFKLV